MQQHKTNPYSSAKILVQLNKSVSWNISSSHLTHCSFTRFSPPNCHSITGAPTTSEGTMLRTSAGPQAAKFKLAGACNRRRFDPWPCNKELQWIVRIFINNFTPYRLPYPPHKKELGESWWVSLLLQTLENPKIWIFCLIPPKIAHHLFFFGGGRGKFV